MKYMIHYYFQFMGQVENLTLFALGAIMMWTKRIQNVVINVAYLYVTMKDVKNLTNMEQNVRYYVLFYQTDRVEKSAWSY